MGLKIIGSGRHLPGRPVSNHDLARVMETSHDWIVPRTGIETRHFVAEGETVTDLATHASQTALKDAGIEADDLDYIIFTTMTPDYVFPGSGGLLGARLGIPRTPAIDVRQQCAALPFAFQVANGFMATSVAKTILIVGAEAHAGFMPWNDWETLYDEEAAPVEGPARDKATRHRGLAVLFGDGAGALVVRDEPDCEGIIASTTGSDGRLFDRIYIPTCAFRARPYVTEQMLSREEHIPRMLGPDLFKTAVVEMTRAVRKVCKDAGITPADIDLVLAHQANLRIINAVRDALKVPTEKMPTNVHRYGNTSAGTIPILIDEVRRDGGMEPGKLCCAVALGSGLHWGAVLFRS